MHKALPHSVRSRICLHGDLPDNEAEEDEVVEQVGWSGFERPRNNPLHR